MLFLDLPVNVRDLVLERLHPPHSSIVLECPLDTSEAGVQLCSKTDRTLHWAPPRFRASACWDPLAIMRTSKRLYEEWCHLLYNRTFAVQANSRTVFACPKVPSQSVGRSPSNAPKRLILDIEPASELMT